MDVFYLQEGLVPISNYHSVYNQNNTKIITECFSKFSEEDQRKIKRKFRKILRKSLKSRNKRNNMKASLSFISQQIYVYSYISRKNKDILMKSIV